MITIKLSGGFGNQMFQYAVGKALSLKHKVPLYIDLTFLQQAGVGYIKKSYRDTKLVNYELYVFDLYPSFAKKSDIPWYKTIHSHNKYINYVYLCISSVLAKLNPTHYTESRFSFDQHLLEIKAGYVEGYFQTEKYFVDYADIIRKDFTFAIPPSSKNQEMTAIINNCNAVSIHVRRGDYISNPANAFYNTCTIEYYKQAISYIQDHVQNPVFFFFSDDMHWVRENIALNNSAYYIDFNNDQTNYEDMRLMSLCKHNIIANSSFSRWGARLNTNPDKIIIAPQKWFNGMKLDYSDIVPISWIKI